VKHPDWIVHLCLRTDWEQALQKGVYHCPSLGQEGFIHFSRPGQILQVANTFYQALPGLVLLWVNPQKLTSRLQWDPVEQTIFPHLYGELNLDAVIQVTDFYADEDGVFRKI
jgi:uncharacterized protein (DUF952 family)